jgi:hypothetical protein
MMASISNKYWGYYAGQKMRHGDYWPALLAGEGYAITYNIGLNNNILPHDIPAPENNSDISKEASTVGIILLKFLAITICAPVLIGSLSDLIERQVIKNKISKQRQSEERLKDKLISEIVKKDNATDNKYKKALSQYVNEVSEATMFSSLMAVVAIDYVKNKPYSNAKHDEWVKGFNAKMDNAARKAPNPRKHLLICDQFKTQILNYISEHNGFDPKQLSSRINERAKKINGNFIKEKNESFATNNRIDTKVLQETIETIDHNMSILQTMELFLKATDKVAAAFEVNKNLDDVYQVRLLEEIGGAVPGNEATREDYVKAIKNRLVQLASNIDNPQFVTQNKSYYVKVMANAQELYKAKYIQNSENIASISGLSAEISELSPLGFGVYIGKFWLNAIKLASVIGIPWSEPYHSYKYRHTRTSDQKLINFLEKKDGVEKFSEALKNGMIMQNTELPTSQLAKSIEVNPKLKEAVKKGSRLLKNHKIKEDDSNQIYKPNSSNSSHKQKGNTNSRSK